MLLKGQILMIMVCSVLIYNWNCISQRLFTSFITKIEHSLLESNSLSNKRSRIGHLFCCQTPYSQRPKQLETTTTPTFVKHKLCASRILWNNRLTRNDNFAFCCRDEAKEMEEALKCGPTQCTRIKCIVGPFSKDQEVWVAFRGRVFAETLKAVSER